MRRYTLNMLGSWLEGNILNIYQKNEEPAALGKIAFLEETGEINPDALYICEAEKFAKLLECARPFPDGFTVILGGSLKEKNSLIPGNIIVIETGLSLIPLYNLLNKNYNSFWKWIASLRELIYRNDGLQAIIDKAKRGLDAAIILTNSGYKLLAAAYNESVSDPTTDELKENGYLSFDTIQDILNENKICESVTGDYCEYISSKSGNYTYVYLIYYQDNLIARLCLILNGSRPNPYYSELGKVLSDYITEYLFNGRSIDYMHRDPFGTLIADILEFRLTDTDELNQRIKQVSPAFKRYYQLLLVGFPDSDNKHGIPWNYIMNQLSFIFPYSNVTMYSKYILLLCRKTNRGLTPEYDSSKLTKLLETYSGKLVIGNSSEFLTSLPSMYKQTLDVLRIAHVMDPEKRVIYFEDYSIYQMIELAADSMYKNMGSKNLVYLCNNEFVSLLLYDKKHGTNLTDEVAAFLINERNTTQTAKSLYVHRNTMINKIQKAESIIGASLDSPTLRLRLIISYYVKEYMTKYLHEDMLILKKNSGSENTAD